MNKTYIVVVYAHSHYCNWWKNFLYLQRLFSVIKRQRLHIWSRKFTWWEENTQKQYKSLNHSFYERKEAIKGNQMIKFKKWRNKPHRLENHSKCAIATLKGFFSSFVYQQVGLIWWRIQRCTDRFNQKWSSKNGTKLS